MTQSPKKCHRDAITFVRIIWTRFSAVMVKKNRERKERWREEQRGGEMEGKRGVLLHLRSYSFFLYLSLSLSFFA